MTDEDIPDDILKAAHEAYEIGTHDAIVHALLAERRRAEHVIDALRRYINRRSSHAASTHEAP